MKATCILCNQTFKHENPMASCNDCQVQPDYRARVLSYHLNRRWDNLMWMEKHAIAESLVDALSLKIIPEAM